jgi:hypothetical protein
MYGMALSTDFIIHFSSLTSQIILVLTYTVLDNAHNRFERGMINIRREVYKTTELKYSTCKTVPYLLAQFEDCIPIKTIICLLWLLGHFEVNRNVNFHRMNKILIQ